MKEKKQEKRQEKKQEIVSVKHVLVFIAAALLPGLIYFLYSFMCNRLDDVFVAHMIKLVLLSVVFLFVLLMAAHKNGFYYNNVEHPGRFFAIYGIGILLTVLNTFLPDKLWLFLPLAAMLVLFSGLQTGICAYVILLYLQVLLTGAVSIIIDISANAVYKISVNSFIICKCITIPVAALCL